jgi:hypothetical protein
MNAKSSVPFSSPRFRHGILATLITVLTLAVIVLLNMVVTALFAKYPLNIDLTENKVFEISPDTRKFLASLTADADIYILNTEEGFASSSPPEYFAQANEVIRKYAQLSPRVHLSYVDLLRSPGFGTRYEDLELRVNDILVTSGGQSRSLESQDLFNIRDSYYGSYIASSRAEQAITRALLNVANRDVTQVMTLIGHGEEDVTVFTGLLEMNNYQTSALNLLTGDIAPEASLAILAAPRRDLTAEELRKLDGFLSSGNNKTLFYLASADQPPLPNLEAFLAEWGMAVESGVAFDSDASRMLSNSPYLALLDYAEGQFSQVTASRDLAMVIPNSRPLRALFESGGYRAVTTLLCFSTASGIRPADAAPDWQPAAGDLSPGIPALMISRSLRNGPSGDLRRSNVLVSGSFLALNQSLLSSPNMANAAYFLDMLSVLTGREQTFYIEDKTLGFTELGAATSQVMIMTIIFAGLLPLALLSTGAAVWLRRRHL